MSKTIKVGKVKIGPKQPLVLIAGPCVIETKSTTFKIASRVKDIASAAKIPVIFKASYDKANRTSISSFRGVGMRKGLEILKEVKDKFGLLVTSDVHEVDEVGWAAEVLDIIQIPAFLCRQTDLLVMAGKSGRVVNIKKGQFLAPKDMVHAIKKVEHTGNKNILLTERGTSFGYNNLVSDFRSLSIMKELGYPVIFDATHSVQQPGGLGKSSGGLSEFIPLLARCGVAAGCDGIFVETHINPKKALSDGPNMLALSQLKRFIQDLKAIHKVVS